MPRPLAVPGSPKLFLPEKIFLVVFAGGVKKEVSNLISYGLSLRFECPCEPQVNSRQLVFFFVLKRVPFCFGFSAPEAPERHPEGSQVVLLGTL